VLVLEIRNVWIRTIFHVVNRFLMLFLFLKLKVASVCGLPVVGGGSNQVEEAVISGKDMCVASCWFIISLSMNPFKKLAS